MGKGNSYLLRDHMGYGGLSRLLEIIGCRISILAVVVESSFYILGDHVGYGGIFLRSMISKSQGLHIKLGGGY